MWGPLDPKHMRGLLEGFLAAVKSRFGDCYGLGKLEGDAILDPLRVILLDGMAMGGSIGLELGIVEEGGGVLMERDLVSGLLEEVGGVSDYWSSSCLAKFSHFLGMLTKGFEGGILKLLKRMKERKGQRGR